MASAFQLGAFQPNAFQVVGAEAVISGIGGAGGYIRRVRAKPQKPTVKPKPLDGRTVRLAVREQDDTVSAAATVHGESRAEAEAARKRRVIDHNNNFIMAE